MREAIRAGLILLLAWSVTAQAQIFDDPENLEVLPKDISPEQLRNTMRGFAMGTGLRCHNCHVGEAGADLSTYDFAADDKEMKQTARTMLKMVQAINGDLLSSLDEDRVQVQCVTCHRGVKKPRMTDEVLLRAAEQGGADSLSETYRELRGRYYGTHSYDFSDMTLASVAQSLAAGGRMDEAVVMLDLMLEDNPDSFNAHVLYGEVNAARGDTEAAASHYRRAMEINPAAAGFVQPKLDALTPDS